MKSWLVYSERLDELYEFDRREMIILLRMVSYRYWLRMRIIGEV